MEKIYFALVDTPGIFAALIRLFTGINYVHVVLALDGQLQEAYSMGRRNPAVPLIAGFEKEDTYEIERVFPMAKYRIMSIECSESQKEEIARQLRNCYRQRYHYHYCILGLPFLVFGVPFYQKNHYTCSSFLARLLDENGLCLFEKHFSLVTPRDFYELKSVKLEYEGTLRRFNGSIGMGAVYES